MNQNDWRVRWQQGQTGWDLGGAHPALPALWQSALGMNLVTDESAVFVPGCGAGHEAGYLAERGCKVDAIDFVQEAITAARTRYKPSPYLNFAVGDVLTEPEENARAYDVIVDRAMLCALAPEQREPYLKVCAQRLKPGGCFLGILFSKVVLEDGRMGPPFELNLPHVTQLMNGLFTLVNGWEQAAPPQPSAIKREFCCIWRRA